MNTPQSNNAPIKLMHIDDSAIVRRMVTGFFDHEPNIEILATAENGKDALQQLENIKPDVVILDIEMPEMDGITALPLILQKCPGVKVIMCSSLTERGAEITMQAFSLGAIECIAKPTTTAGGDNKFDLFRSEVIRTVKGLFLNKFALTSSPSEASAIKAKTEDITAKILRQGIEKTKSNKDEPIGVGNSKASLSNDAPAVKPADFSKLPEASDANSEDFTLYKNPRAYIGKPEVLAIGSSTGGPQALFEVLSNLKDLSVPIVITQHMPPTFTKLLAQHITQNTGIETCEGENAMTLENGKIYVAPGGFHMTFKKNSAGKTEIVLDDGPQVNYCKPAVDPMFSSLVALFGEKVLGVILTGMGSDGLEGSKHIVSANGRVISQDKSTSTVWGMPRAVTLANICAQVLPLKEIGPWIKKQIV